MADQTDRIQTVLKKIRDEAQNALNLLVTSDGQRALAWRCVNCGHVKHFTRAVPFEVVARCPKCKSDAFRAC